MFLKINGIFFCLFIFSIFKPAKAYDKPPIYRFTVKYHGEIDALRQKLPPEDYINYEALYKKIYQAALENYKPNQYHKSGKLVFKFHLDSGKNLVCTGLQKGFHNITDSVFLKFARSVKMEGNERDVDLVLPLYINVSRRKTDTKDTLDLWYLRQFNSLKFQDMEILYNAERCAEFPGGEQQISNYISDAILVPEEIKYNEWTSKLTVKFMVDERGIVLSSQIKCIGVMSSADSIWFQEIKRVLKESPRWRPRSFKGKNLYSYHLVTVACMPED
ncbi:MAG: hypothetical protein KG003_03235 [Bacteroidetes bacterium]|nr:hypothetical protein [Bacteroidota bacterium]